MSAILGSLIALLAPLLFCLSLMDIALRSVQYHRINAKQHKGNKDAQELFSVLSSPERAISVLLFLRYTVAGILFALTGILIYASGLSWLSSGLVLLIASLTILILLEYVPRMLAVQNPERIAFTFVKPFAWLLKFNSLLPIPQLCERLASRFLRLYGFHAGKLFSQYSVSEIKMFLSINAKGTEEESQNRQFEKFFDFSGRLVREVMVARPFVKAIDLNTSLKSLKRTIEETAFSRIPVYRGNLDNILGILHVKEIIGAVEPFSLEHYLRKPFFVPETATVQAAFHNMQRHHAQFALVVDEYGGIDGIVTMEDLLEELVGEIHDEYDEEIRMLQPSTDGSWMLEGNLSIKELNQNLKTNIPEDSSYTTVAGFLMTVLDRIPAEKDQILYNGLLFSVDRMAGHKISRVHLKVAEK